MKFLVVVLAVASLCLAEPEADPAYLYAAPYAYAPYWWVRPAQHTAYGYGYPGTYTHVSRLDKREAEADPALLVAPYALPYAVPYASAVVPQVRPYTPYDCVTPGGCNVATLKSHGLAKRDAEADPGLLYAPGFYGGLYNPYYYVPRVAPVVSSVSKPVTYTHLGAHPIHPTSVVETTSQVVGHTLVRREAEAEADANPAFLYAPGFYGGLYNPYYYVPRVAPVVASVSKPVTYTHLGAHPIHPTSVVETTSQVVGHTLVRREAEAEADANPAFLYAPGFYGGLYNPYHYVPRVAPVVASVSKPVTYTHLGAHPIHPTSVVETTSQVVGHALV